jgi:hypothetical protein
MALKRSYNGIPAREMKQFLEEKYLQYNNPSFIESDPVSIPHAFSDLHDRLITHPNLLQFLQIITHKLLQHFQ